MKLPEGVTVHAGGRVYKGEIPDDRMPKGLKKKLEGKDAKPVKKSVKAD